MQRGVVRSEGWDIYSRVFDGEAALSSVAVRLNSYTYGDQFAPKITALGQLQLVVWSSLGQDGSWEGVYGQLLSGGVPVDSEIHANTTTLSKQIHPVIAADGQDRFVVGWSGFDLNSSFDLFAQCYVTTQPLAQWVVREATLQRAAVGEAARDGSALRLSRPVSANDSAASGEVTLPMLSLQGATAARDQLNWTTQPGARYQIQTSTNLKVWSNVGEPRAAAATSDGLGIDRSEQAVFYRVLRLP